MQITKKIIALGILFALVLDWMLWVQAKETNTEEIIYWMYDNWLSMYSNSNTFKPDINIRRDEASKFIAVFAENILDQQWESNAICHNFNDISKTNTLKDYIIQACELWYMKWKNNKFSPTKNLTNEQAIAIVIRIQEWRLEEPENNRSENYYTRANELGLSDWLSLSNKTSAITRGTFATLLYRSNELWREDTLADSLVEWMEDIITSFIDMLWIKINSNTGISNEFITQASLCLSWASTITEIDFDMMGMNFYIKSYRQIRGFEWNQCKVYERADAANVGLSPEMITNAINSWATQSEIDQQIEWMQSQIQEIIGKDGICLYTTWTLVINLQKELSGEFLPMENIGNANDNCTWALYEDN